MVYTSTSLSLAAVEYFVHLEGATEPADLVSISAELPAEQSLLSRQGEELLGNLPGDWRRLEHLGLRQLGADWITTGRSLAMMVPSAVIDGEWNVLINPAHPDAAKIMMEEPKPFRFDSRMFRATERRDR